MSIEIQAKCDRCQIKHMPKQDRDNGVFVVPVHWSEFVANGATYHLCSSCAECVQRFILATGLEENILINPDGTVNEDTPLEVSP